MKEVLQLDKFKALDACHAQMHTHLAELAALIELLDASSDSVHCRQSAKTIEAFFSLTSREHHAEEERNIFPGLLQSERPELVQAVRTLQQDHGWIEQNWLELAPMLRAIAAGEDWVDMAEMKHNAEVFLSLCHDHIVIEETLIYPQARKQFVQQLASRAKRLEA